MNLDQLKQEEEKLLNLISENRSKQKELKRIEFTKKWGIDKVLSELKTLKSEYQKAEKLSEKSLNIDFKNNIPKQI